MSLYEGINNKLKEGITLTAFVRDEDGNSKLMTDNDYNSKNDYARDLRANGYTVINVKDNRDMYVLDHSEYRSLNALINQMNLFKRYYKEENKEVWKRNYEELKAIYDEAMKQEL